MHEFKPGKWPTIRYINGLIIHLIEEIESSDNENEVKNSFCKPIKLDLSLSQQNIES